MTLHTHARIPLYVCRLALGTIIALLALLGAGSRPGVSTPAIAQSTSRLDSLSVSLWPEYDDPRLLVIYQGQFPAGAAPALVSLTIPADAEIIATAYLASDGVNLLNAPEPVQSSPVPGGIQVTYPLPEPTFHLEFYVPISRTGTTRQIAHLLNVPYEAAALTVDIQEPTQATNFTVTPAGGSKRSEAGFQYTRLDLGAVQAGQKIPITITYNRVTLTPAVTKAQNEPANQPPTGGTNDLIRRLLLGLSASLISGTILIVVWQWWQKRASPVVAQPSPTLYCTACGARLPADALFCPHCGQKRAAPLEVDREAGNSLPVVKEKDRRPRRRRRR